MFARAADAPSASQAVKPSGATSSKRSDTRPSPTVWRPTSKLQLAAALPKGADVYFDNVGGSLLAEVAPLMARGGLVLICGLMAGYQNNGAHESTDHLPEVMRAVMFKGLRIQGFSQVGQDALRPAFEEELAALLSTGQIKPRVTVENGIERLPHALVNLFDKSTMGKVVVRVAEAAASREDRQ